MNSTVISSILSPFNAKLSNELTENERQQATPTHRFYFIGCLKQLILVDTLTDRYKIKRRHLTRD